MLGLLDLLRAVKGSVTLAVRRMHPVVGGVLVAALWIGALGAMFTFTRDDPPSPRQEASSLTDPGRGGSDDSATTAEGDEDGDNDGSGDSWDQRSEWTSDDDGSTTTTVVTPGADLAADIGSAPSTRPSSSTPEPSWRPSSTTTTSTSTTTPGATSTTTTAPPSSGGGLLGGLADLLGLGKK